MLSLVQTYGLSHVCARSEFENIGSFVSADSQAPNFNFPYLDIYFDQENINLENIQSYQEDIDQEKNIKFYFRGARDQELKFQNLFEYLLSTSVHGTGL